MIFKLFSLQRLPGNTPEQLVVVVKVVATVKTTLHLLVWL